MARTFTTFLAVCLLLLGSQSTEAENRTYDGTGNNLLHPSWGAAGTPLSRLAPAAYDDGISIPRGASTASLPNPRVVSNTVVAQAAMNPNSHAMTDWVFQWGQFVDHDLDLTEVASPAEAFNIPIPTGDPIFDPTASGTKVMALQRSRYDLTTGTDPSNPRQQINELTSYLDGSMVYGSDPVRAAALRTHTGGLLKSSEGNLMPLNTFALPNATGAPADPTQFYLAGDPRANEQVGLTAVHTLFVREHNRLATEIGAANPTWSDEQIYHRARKLVGGQIASITYQEFLPALLGTHAPEVVNSYDPEVDASVFTEFSTALFRVGHTMLPPEIKRIENDGTPAAAGPVPLRHAFFLPQNMAVPGEVERILKGLASDMQQEVDMHIVDDVRDFLFGDPVPGGFDLASLNIQRGRDHGLPDYNSLRVALGLPAISSFSEISSDPAVQAGLAAIYGDIDTIDAWVGALSEDHLPGASVGPLIAAGLVEQFTRLRDGDRLWFLSDADLSGNDRSWLLGRRLSDVIRANTSITNLQHNVFFMAVPEPTAGWLLGGCFAIAIRRARARHPA